MTNEITKEKVKKYQNLSEKALNEIKANIVKCKEKDAKEIIEMVENYLSDAKYFQNKGDLINAFAALNYCHGWMDSGVKLGIFNVKDNKLFTIK